jgi:anthranilate synthase component 2
MAILLLDNYDSFTYNLLHLLEQLSPDVITVAKNDQISIEDVNQFDRIILSPGPGLPSEAGIMPNLLRSYHMRKPIFGVCLGLQAIAECFGSRLQNLPEVVHGRATPIKVLKDKPLFRNCPDQFTVGRYHSWVVDKNTLGAELEIAAVDLSGEIMALQHRHLNVCGVQFHPESILSENGALILSNWLRS